MPRPVKWRRVSSIPRISLYGPVGMQNKDTDIVVMSIEELESIRLMDMEGHDQAECAEMMGVARSTFQRIYSEAKKKVADSIINGKMLRIEGGNYTLNICDIICRNCGHKWNESYENIVENNIECPKCGSNDQVCCIESESMDVCRMCRRHRRGHGHGPENY